jgi:hypothetical protein
MLMIVHFTRFLSSARVRRSILPGLLAVLWICAGPAVGGEVALRWDPPAQSAGISGYKIYYGTESRHYTHSIDVGQRLSHKIEDLEEDAAYYFAATAYISNRAHIQHIYDAERSSRVIQLSGAGLDHGYRLPTAQMPGGGSTEHFVVEWSMNYAEPFEVFIDVETTGGHRYLAYPPVDVDSLGAGEFVRHGIGSHVMDGRWHTISRDLQMDLAAAQPGVKVIAVNSFMIRGSGRLDDIRLHRGLPGNTQTVVYEDGEDTQVDGWHLYLDLAGDAIVEESDFSNEVAAYIGLLDTDNDGLSDRDEQIEYGTDPHRPDTDGDGSIDGIEIHWGVNPLDRTSFPETSDMTSTYDDGSGAQKWGVYLDLTHRLVPPEVVTVHDSERGGSVVQFSGSGIDHGYRLSSGPLGKWHNTDQFILQWSMKYIEIFEILIGMTTSAGSKYLIYAPVDHDGLGVGKFVRYGIGSDAADGSWRTYVRDLQADIERAQPGVSITSVDGFLIRGSGRLDDIKLHRQFR